MRFCSSGTRECATEATSTWFRPPTRERRLPHAATSHSAQFLHARRAPPTRRACQRHIFISWDVNPKKLKVWSPGHSTCETPLSSTNKHVSFHANAHSRCRRITFPLRRLIQPIFVYEIKVSGWSSPHSIRRVMAQGFRMHPDDFDRYCTLPVLEACWVWRTRSQTIIDTLTP